MITYLLSSKSLISSKIINEIPSIHADEFLVSTDNESLKICTLNDDYTFELKLSIDSISSYYFTKGSSHVLLVDEKNNLSIYNLKTADLIWTTDQFEDQKLQIHSLQSTFILIGLQTKEICYIDMNTLKLKTLAQLQNDCLFSTVVDHRLYIIATDQTTLLEFDITQKTLRNLSPVALNSKQIVRLGSVSNNLIFHTNDHQINLWKRRKEQIIQLEKALDFISKDNRLVLLSTDNQTIILYDLKEKLRGTIQLDANAGQCKAMNLNEYNSQSEQYLFLLCEDEFLRMYTVSNGKQLAKVFIHTNLHPFIGILNNRLLLKVENQLCIIQIIDKNSLSKK